MIKKIVDFFKRFSKPDFGEDNSIKLQTVEERVRARRNKALVAAVAIIGVMLLAMSIKDIVTPYITGEHVREKQEEKEKKRLLDPPQGAKQGEIADAVKISEDWKTIMEKKIEEQDKEIQKLKKEKEEQIKKDKEGYPQKPLLEVAPIPTGVGVKNTPINLNQPMMPQQPQPQQQEKVEKVEPVVQPTFRSIEFKFDKPEAKKASTNTSAKEKKMFIPIGFANGMTINGADTPTFQWGQNDPQKILTVIETKMITAGGKEIDIRGCLVETSAHGAVSSERALPRAIKMQCRDKNGDLYSGAVDGYILGDDGKVGMSGRLVSKQGAVMAKAFIAGILDGVANILKAQSYAVSVSPLGATQTIDPSKAVQAGLAQGVINSTEKLQSFYIKYAEQIFPVIEVLPGSAVTVMFSGGVLTKVTDESVDEEMQKKKEKQETIKETIKKS